VTKSHNSGPPAPAGGATGLRTPENKDKGKFNATTHGIFSGVVVLTGESRSDYESLLNGLREVFQTKGALEEILVDKLAMILWRHRRLILAEHGQFLKNAQIHESELKKRQQDEAEKIEASLEPTFKTGLVKSISNPAVLDRCLERLTTLRDRIQHEGDESASMEDCAILRKIYGPTGEGGQETLLDTYAMWLDRIETTGDEGHTRTYLSEAISDEKVLQAMEAEIHRLEEFKKSQRPDQLERGRREVLQLSMNEGAGLERLVRYEASLERAFDRTLAQLERVQRIRLGQPVAPRLELGLNH
jgi:hypothetical protein